MASSGKTKFLGLNAWAATDPVLRDDFNTDNQLLDTALSKLLVVPALYYATGAYVGDGRDVGPGQSKSAMSLTFDFEPLVVFLDLLDSPQLKSGTILFKPCTKAKCTSSVMADNFYINLTWLANGVQWYGSNSADLNNYNINGATYVYGAFGRKTL